MALLLAYEHSLVRPGDLRRLDTAFFTMNGVISVVFAAFVNRGDPVTLGEEHMRHEWLSPNDALERFVWPRERQALRDVLQLLAPGHAGPVEDVLRVF